MNKVMETIQHWGRQVVWATHPVVVNLTRNARGRVLHMRRPIDDDKFEFVATYCGMKVSTPASKSDYMSRGMCINCESIFHQEAA